MTDIYSRLRPARSQNASLKSSLSNMDSVDLSAAPMAQDVALPATPSLSLAITTATPMDAPVKSEPSLKLEDDASPSQSPTLVSDVAAQNFKPSCSPKETPFVPDGTSSSSPTPPPRAAPKTSRKGAPLPVQLIGDLPIAREEAVRTFNEIHDNNYQYKSLGRSRELLESMTCDCIYEHGVDSADVACGPYSDCINRLTQVECLEDDCRCRKYCQNQRFQRKEYANIEIVLTEKKGYGLRAEEDLPKDTFIYEYVGDVVNPVSFKKRMREYAEEGIRHFYFMMLQKDEFIDATKSGGIGRFANHSCNPNCYVAKWTIGNHVRMGIFAKRNIQKHEELTFNYNVDRYGHQAQECFCGEPMCVGYIGGKTQTDIATMDDLYLDALGITDEDDLMELKGTKKKKGKKIDDPDFMPVVKSITEKEVPKVIQAVMQTTSRKVLSKLLTRIKITDDQAALRQIMRLRGYSLMTCVLQDWHTDLELVALALECMKTWPLLNRNKVQDSKVHVPVEACATLEDETVKTLAQSLLDHWATLPTYNRIPKRAVTDTERIDVSTPIAAIDDPRVRAPPLIDLEEENRRKQRRTNGSYSGPIHKVNPEGVLAFALERERMALERERLNLERQEKERAEEKLKRIQEQLEFLAQQKAQDASAKAIIAQVAAAAAAEEATLAAAAAEAKKKLEQSAERIESSKDRAARKKTISPEEKEKNKEKRLMKLVGAVVVKCMSKHSKQFDRESFKKHAKELTQIISDKEKKSSSYRDNKLEGLSEEKEVKIKKFAKDYIVKVIRKMEKSKRPQGSTSLSASTANNTPSTSMTTPNSNDGGDSRHPDTAMSVEEAMGMGLHESDSEAGDDEVTDGAEDRLLTNNSAAMLPPKLPSRTLEHFREDDSMEVDDVHAVSVDPRRRHYTDIH